jgi:L-amino acid N-acyltransferase YncA
VRKRPRADLRPAEVADAPGIREVYGPYVTTSVSSFEEVPPSADEIGRRMLEPPRLPWFVASRSGEVVGYSYASHHRVRPAYRWSVDCSVYLAESELGVGTGRALYERLLPQLCSLGYVSAFAGIALPNAASVGLHEVMGFVGGNLPCAKGQSRPRSHSPGPPARERPPATPSVGPLPERGYAAFLDRPAQPATVCA